MTGYCDFCYEKEMFPIVKQEKEQLAKKVCELQSDLAKAKTMIEKMKCCFNCDKPIKHLDCEDCHNGSNWELAQSDKLIRS